MTRKKPSRSALSVSEGVDSPGAVNRKAVDRLIKQKKRAFSASELLNGIRHGDRGMLSRAITLVESSLPEHQPVARDLISKCLPHAGRAFRIGITGIPGAGKSTFIESFGLQIIGRGGRMAVLAIDPSSKRSKGSILGDKTRMEELAGRPEAFIRPSPSGGTLGGVARKTRETIILCEAAGFDHIIVETVGVGQSETAVNSMVDFFLLIMLAGAGDELQGIKRGIMEMADAILINKADGQNIAKAKRARSEFANALHLFPPPPSGWVPRVLTCSALRKEGIREIWDMAMEYREQVTASGYLDERRNLQSGFWMLETIREGIYDTVFDNPKMKQALSECEDAVNRGKMTPDLAAAAILEKFRNLYSGTG